MKCFVAEYTSIYQRRLAPRPLRSSERYYSGRDDIEDHVVRLGTAHRDFEAFFVNTLGKQGDLDALQQEAKFLQSTLERLHRSFRDVQTDYRRSDKQYDAGTLNNTMEAQTEEARTSKETSLKIGWLSQIAFFFLPLQLTTSILGMNFKAFGNGNVHTSTFVGLALGIATFALLPVLWRFSKADIVSLRI